MHEKKPQSVILPQIFHRPRFHCSGPKAFGFCHKQLTSECKWPCFLCDDSHLGQVYQIMGMLVDKTRTASIVFYDRCAVSFSNCVCWTRNMSSEDNRCYFCEIAEISKLSVTEVGFTLPLAPCEPCEGLVCCPWHHRLLRKVGLFKDPSCVHYTALYLYLARRCCQQ